MSTVITLSILAAACVGSVPQQNLPVDLTHTDASGRNESPPRDEFDLDSFDLSFDDLLTDDPNPMAGCTLCHVDIGDKFAGSPHETEGVGCTTCHGLSKGHVAEENNNVKPDEVFARKDIDRLCSVCHELPPEVPEDSKELPIEQRQVCTDCHDPHTLLARKAGD